MKRVYLGNKELTTIATVTNGGGGGDDTKKWVDYFNGTLTEFTVPEGVTKIRNCAFYACSSLTGITIPDSVTKIGDSAFYDCSNLTGITIPDGVTSIDYGAFYNSYNLRDMTVKATTPPTLGNNALPYELKTIYVPASSVDAYKAASGWSSFADKIQAIPT